MENMLIPYTFNILAHFFHFMVIIYLKNVDLNTFWGGSEKEYVLYTHLNVDNYGRPLRSLPRSTDQNQYHSQNLFICRKLKNNFIFI